MKILSCTHQNSYAEADVSRLICVFITIPQLQVEMRWVTGCSVALHQSGGVTQERAEAEIPEGAIQHCLFNSCARKATHCSVFMEILAVTIIIIMMMTSMTLR